MGTKDDHSLLPPPQAPAPGSSSSYAGEEKGPHCRLLRPLSLPDKLFPQALPMLAQRLLPQGHDAKEEFLTHHDALWFSKCRDVSAVRETWAQIQTLTLTVPGPSVP